MKQPLSFEALSRPEIALPVDLILDQTKFWGVSKHSESVIDRHLL